MGPTLESHANREPATRDSRPTAMRSWSWILTIPLIATAVSIATAGVAAASCAGPPAPSSHAFTGTALAVEHEGRVATVKTDDGRTVVVRGTPNESGFTSVDRTYTVGARYEFHPVNATNPFEDNACTATRMIAAGEGVPVDAEDAGNATGGGAVASNRVSFNVGPVLAGLALLAIVVAAGLIRAGATRRKRG
jgi:hypothetical protein